MVVGPAPLPNGRVVLSRLGLGTAPLGGLYAAGTEDEAVATVAAALDAGVRHVDTAPLYGYGLAERRVGEALRALGRPAVVSTKVGRLVEPVAERDADDMFTGAPPGRAVFDFSAAGVRRSLEASLDRLGLERVDVLLVHDPDDHLDQAIGEAIPAAVELREQGIVAAVGAGMNDAGALARIVTATDVDVVLVAGRLSLLDRSASRELLPLCRERGVGVVVGGVFNSGILADPDRTPMYDYAPAPAEVRRAVATMAEACARHGVPLRAAAVQLPLRYEGVTSVLVGARTAAEVRDAVAMAGLDVPEALWAELDEIAATSGVAR